MKRSMIFLALTAALAVQPVFGQFNIKLPSVKREKPKTEEAKPETKPENKPEIRNTEPETETRKQTSRKVYEQTPRPATPVIIKDSIDLRIREHDEYWKFPNQRNYSSWVPEIRIHIFYNDQRPVKYAIAYSNPDGTAWFGHDLEYTGSMLRSPNLYDQLNSKSTNATGVYSFKITDTETSKTVYEGKFRVGKFSRAYDAVRDKNKFGFFVDYDWTLPFGVVGFDGSDLALGLNFPHFRFWIKGPVESSELEARIFHNGRQVASTADGARGNVVTTNFERMSGFAPAFVPNSVWKQWEFKFANFALENGNPYNKEWYAQAHLFDKNPGEYVVKVFRKGVQIREMAFTVGSDGRFVVPSYSGQLPMPNHQIFVPVKVTDPTEKWNAAAWKTEAFFGNPVTGFGQ